MQIINPLISSSPTLPSITRFLIAARLAADTLLTELVGLRGTVSKEQTALTGGVVGVEIAPIIGGADGLAVRHSGLVWLLVK